ncbi:MAG: acyl-CoA thioesterase [Oscillospiraceae bacterium]|nr:acyl-CoA thioesterase [Oscillospiraceae bacterium]
MTETIIQVRYPDLDPMGIVHHAVYPIWYEMARMELLQNASFPWPKQHELGIDPVMVSLNLEYLAPVRYPGEVVIKSQIILAEPKKLKIRYECFSENGAVCNNRAESFHIWCRDMKSLNLQEAEPEIFAGLVEAIENF